MAPLRAFAALAAALAVALLAAPAAAAVKAPLFTEEVYGAQLTPVPGVASSINATGSVNITFELGRRDANTLKYQARARAHLCRAAAAHRQRYGSAVAEGHERLTRPAPPTGTW